MDQFLIFLAHHWVLVSVFFIILMILIVMELPGYMNSIPQLTPQQAIDLINHQNAIVIDIRSVDDFAAGHIAGAMHIPLDALAAQKNKLSNFQSRPIVTVCNRGRSSNIAALELRKMGFSQVNSLSGGMTGWREAELPVIKGDK